MNRPVWIVVVEDNHADVLLLREALGQIKVVYTLEHYTNGEDAAKGIAAMQETPDLVLLDINVPRVPGLELLTLIRKHARIANTTVAMFTSSTAVQDRLQAEQLGADDYIIKPTGFFEFVNGVGRAIQRLLEGRMTNSAPASRLHAGGCQAPRRRFTRAAHPGLAKRRQSKICR